MRIAAAMVGLLVLVAIAQPLIGVLSVRPDPAQLVASLDQLEVPASWPEEATIVHSESGGDVRCEISLLADCPTVARYFTVAIDLEPREAFETVLGVVTESGFQIENAVRVSTCQLVEQRVCRFWATRGPDRIEISVYRPGEGDGEGPTSPDHIVVRAWIKG